MRKTKIPTRWFIMTAIVFFAHLPLLLADPPIDGSEHLHIVSRVLEDYVLELNDGQHVRLIGVDAVESLLQSPSEARKSGIEFARKLVEGKKVRIKAESQLKDDCGRWLVYVFIETDKPAQSKVNWIDEFVIMTDRSVQEIFLNATLLRAGYAQMNPLPPNAKYADLFLKLQTGAREQKRGLWGEGEIQSRK